MTVQLKQIYKTRAEAYRDFIKAKEVPVSRAKFFEDCIEFHMVRPDKTVLLADLVAYVERETRIDLSGPRRDLAAEDRQRKFADLELRERELKIEKLEREKRKGDQAWMERVAHVQQMASLAARIEESLQQITTMRLDLLVHSCGGDRGRVNELAQMLDDLYADALTEAAHDAEAVILWEAGDTDDETGRDAPGEGGLD